MNLGGTFNDLAKAAWLEGLPFAPRPVGSVENEN